MMRVFAWGRIGAIWIGMVFGAAPVLAQELQPSIDVDFEETETVPGQMVTLRLTILVPTFMPSPPEWPSFEAPNLLVRLPEKASTPTSKTIGGQTWAGISRRYQITPLVPGTFVIPQSTVLVRYQAPDGSAEGGDVLQANLPVPELTLRGVVPKEAEGLEPFLAAEGLRLNQTVEGSPGDLAAGGSFTREVRADIDGAAAMVLPPLVPEEALDGLRAYPETPSLEETDNRGALSGARRERVVYMAEGGVSGALPEITLRWYNLNSGQVEEASVPAIEVHAQAAAVRGTEAAQVDWGLWVLGALGGMIVAGAVGLGAARFLMPPLSRLRRARRAAWQASEPYAWRELQAAVAAQDLGGLCQAYDVWRRRLPEDEAADAAVLAAFVTLGGARFGAQKGDTAPAWRDLAQDIQALRQRLRYREAREMVDLPALNPKLKI